MRLIYKGIDITDSVEFEKCYYDTYSANHGNGAVITFKDKSNVWDKYNPKLEDVIKITEGPIDTGDMRVVSVIPQTGRYTIEATALPSEWNTVRDKKWNKVRYSDILEGVAETHKLDLKTYSINDRWYSDLEQKNINDLAFLHKISKLEGNDILIRNNTLVVYGVSELENQEVTQIIDVDDSNHLRFIRNIQYGSVEVHGKNKKYVLDYRNGPRYILDIDTNPDNEVVALREYAMNVLKLLDRSSERGWFFTKEIAKLSAGSVVILNSSKNSFNGRIFIEHIRHDFKNNSSKIFFRKVFNYDSD